MSAINAAARFLSSTSKNYTGQSINIVLVEEGVPALSNIRNLNTQFAENFSTDLSEHANKIASLIAVPEIGLAPNVNLFCINHQVIYENRFNKVIKEIVKQHGKIAISVHAYSGMPDPYLFRLSETSFRACQQDLETRHLIIAAAGHKGEGMVRYPACLPYALAIGVYQDNNICSFSGFNKEICKPELLVENYNYCAHQNETQLSSISGTSAGVAIVSGMAALWAEKLTSLGYMITPSLLKAALLTTSLPFCSEAVHCVMQEFLDKSLSIKEVSLIPDTKFEINMVVLRTGRIAFTFVSDIEATLSQDFYSLSELQVIFIHNNKELIKNSSRWISIHSEANSGDTIKIILSSKHRVRGFLAMTNASIKDPVEQIRNKKKSLLILGVSASHDASAAILEEGHLKTAIQLERLTRIKRDGVGYLNNSLSAQYCLDALQLSPNDIDYFAYNNQPLMPEYIGLSMPTHDQQFSLFDPFSKNAYFVSHHLAHAFSAFFCSPFDEAVVLVADGSGGSVYKEDDLILSGTELKNYLHQKLEPKPRLHVLSVYLFLKNKVELLHREYADSFNVRCGSNSLGETYAAVSQYIFGSWHDSGKLMGLAPYGCPEQYGASLLEEAVDGFLQFSHSWKNNHRNTLKKDVMANKHLAARIQADFEDAILQRIKHIRQKTKLSNLCYAGGLALNSAANEKIFLSKLFKNIYIFPASNDAGNSVGAAAAVNYHITKTLKKQPVTNMFLGYQYQKQDYHFAIQKYAKYIHYENVTTQHLAELLAKGEIFALFQGGCEFGPRALGHRSIIADPRKKEVWQFINKRIKFREDFRPFAPAVIEGAASQFFDIEGESPYMLRIVKVKTEHQESLQAITHVNGTARVQTITKSEVPFFYELLEKFGEITGYPILVNTSFNMGGYPLVEKPEEAIEMLLCTHLDGILFENILVRANKVKADELGTKKLLLAPDVRLCYESTPDDAKYSLQSHFKGRKTINLIARQFEILNTINKDKTINCLDLTEQEMQWLASISTLNYIYTQRDEL